MPERKCSGILILLSWLTLWTERIKRRCWIPQFYECVSVLNDNVFNAEYICRNTVYGYLILHPEKTKNDIKGLIDALEYLADDYDDPNGFNLINAYSNELTYVKE